MKQQFLAGLVLFVATPSLAADTLISTINWPNIDAFCTFQRADATFDFNDPSSWNFVFFTQHGPDGLTETGYVSINFNLRELEPLEIVQGKDGETRQYRTYGADPYAVTLTMSIDREGYENTDYKGYLTVDGPGGRESIAVRGNCGV